jgi:hypothetical protein
VFENEEDYGSSVFLSWVVMNDFGIQEYAAWNVEGFPSLRQTLQLPHSDLMT